MFAAFCAAFGGLGRLGRLLGGARGDGYYAALTGDDTIYQLPAEQAAPILALAPQA